MLIENKPKFFPVHASSGFKHSLREVLQDPAVQARLADTKAAEEVGFCVVYIPCLSYLMSQICRCAHWTAFTRR